MTPSQKERLAKAAKELQDSLNEIQEDIAIDVSGRKHNRRDLPPQYIWSVLVLSFDSGVIHQ